MTLKFTAPPFVRDDTQHQKSRDVYDSACKVWGFKT